MNTIGRPSNALQMAGLVLLLVLVVLPFAGKPPHIDEESYLFIAHEVQHSPLRPYDWWRPWQPPEPAENSFIYAHPPVFLWWMAMLEAVLGRGRVVWLRLANMPFVLLLGGSVFRLATRFTKHPWLPALSSLLAPAALLVLHQSLMVDLAYVALSTFGVTLLWEYREVRTPALGWFAGAVLGLSILTKYPAMVLLVLLGVGSRRLWELRGGLRATWRVALAALGMVGAWELWTWYAYGRPHLWYVLAHAGAIERTPWLSRLLGGLAQLGWTTFAPPVLLFALSAGVVGRWRVAGSLAVGILVFLLVLGGQAVAGVDLSGQVPRARTLQGLLLLAFFLGTASLSTMSLRTRKDRFLVAWAAVSLLVVAMAHNFASARYLVPAGVPLHLLLWRRFEATAPRWARRPPVLGITLGLGAAVALWVGVADYRLASVYLEVGRDVARDTQNLPSEGRVWFSGKWGFRYQMERLGFRYLETGSPVRPGDLLVVPDTACPGDVSWIPNLTELATHAYGDQRRSLRTMDRKAGIGFYSEAFGLLPYGVASGPLETVHLLEVGE